MNILSMRLFINKLSVACIFMIAAVGEAVSGETQQRSFRDCLIELGERFDCYFTVESWGRGGYQNNRIINANVSIDIDDINDIDDMLSFFDGGIDLV